MQLSTQFTLSPTEALNGTRAFKRRWYVLSMAAGLLLLAMGALTYRLPQGDPRLSLFAMVNGLLFLVLPEAVLRWARLRRGAAAYPPMEVDLDDEGLTLRTETSEGSLPWSAFGGVHRRGGCWLFRISNTQVVLVPERALTEAQAAELLAFLQGRGLLG